MTQNKLESLHRVVSYALANSNDAHNLKRGLTKETEHYAYPHVLSRLTEEDVKNPNYEIVALRVAGMIAATGVPHSPDVQIGRWVQRNSTQEGTETRLTQLVNMDLESAISSIYRLIVSVNGKSGFNWYKLAETLLYWGDGKTDWSLNSRQSVLRSYYISNYVESKDDQEEGQE